MTGLLRKMECVEEKFSNMKIFVQTQLETFAAMMDFLVGKVHTAYPNAELGQQSLSFSNAYEGILTNLQEKLTAFEEEEELPSTVTHHAGEEFGEPHQLPIIRRKNVYDVLCNQRKLEFLLSRVTFKKPTQATSALLTVSILVTKHIT